MVRGFDKRQTSFASLQWDETLYGKICILMKSQMHENAHFSIEGSVKVGNTVDANTEEILGHYVCLGAIPSQWVVVHFKSAQWFFLNKMSRICANL